MVEYLRLHQLNIMMLLCGSCIILALLMMNTRFLTRGRKAILILMEVTAFLLLWFDRLAYIYAGDVSHKGYIMVRLSNFMVFFLTSGIVFGFNLYLSDLLIQSKACEVLPRRLYIVGALSAVGMLMAVIAAFSGLYYYFDEANRYHRAPGFLISYIIPVLCPLMQYTVVRQYKKEIRRLIYISLVLYIFIPISCGILQIFFYGLSIVNMAMVVVSIFLYIFMYLDLNDAVVHAHEIEIQSFQGEQARMQRLFEQTARAFVSAVEKKDEYAKGSSVRVAEYARRIAAMAGKSPEECEKVYYAALLHDVGLIGIPDSVIKNDADPDMNDYASMRQKPLIGEEILSSITEYPYLGQGAHYSHERYNGTGYPDGLKGEAIPEIARIIGVADAYVTMTTKKRYRDARPRFVAREAFVKGAGEEFDPVFANIMVKIIDSESGEADADSSAKLERTIECREYREKVSVGIPVTGDMQRISFVCGTLDKAKHFSGPSIVLFDSYDGRTHGSEKEIDSYHYLEYGEVWFDKYSVTTEARKIEEKRIADEGDGAGLKSGHYEILAARYEDHLKIVMRSAEYSKEATVALPSATQAAYIGLTGENCRLDDILAEKTGESVGEDDIARIVDHVSYIDHFEADVRNIQVDYPRAVYTDAIEIKNSMKISFHTQSMPGASLVWNCPYIVLYSSEDGSVGGENYIEYTMIKLDGENDDKPHEIADNRFVMKKKDEFPGWDEWRAINKKGLDCEVSIEKRGNRVRLRTENLGLAIENTTVITKTVPKVYVVLTGDQVALTDIRIDYLS